MIDVLVIEPDSWTAVPKAVEPELGEFQRLVGGWIEALSLGDTVGAYINEEGKFAPLKRNEAATKFCQHALRKVGRTLIPGDYIAGPLVILGPPGDEGEDRSYTPEAVQLLTEVGIRVQDGSPAPEVVKLPMSPEDVVSTPSGDRTLRARFDTTIHPQLKLQVSTHHDKDRKHYWSTAQGVFVGDVFERYSLMDFVRLGTPVGAQRFSAKDLAIAHKRAVALAVVALTENPDAFTGVLRKCPVEDR